MCPKLPPAYNRALTAATLQVRKKQLVVAEQGLAATRHRSWVSAAFAAAPIRHWHTAHLPGIHNAAGNAAANIAHSNTILTPVGDCFVALAARTARTSTLRSSGGTEATEQMPCGPLVLVQNKVQTRGFTNPLDAEHMFRYSD